MENTVISYSIDSRINHILTKLNNSDTLTISISELTEILNTNNSDNILIYWKIFNDTVLNDLKLNSKLALLKLLGSIITLKYNILIPHWKRICKLLIKRLSDIEVAIIEYIADLFNIVTKYLLLNTDDEINRISVVLKQLFILMENSKTSLNASKSICSIISASVTRNNANTIRSIDTLVPAIYNKCINYMDDKEVDKQAIFNVFGSLILFYGDIMKDRISKLLNLILPHSNNQKWEVRKELIGERRFEVDANLQNNIINTLVELKHDRVPTVRNMIQKALDSWRVDSVESFARKNRPIRPASASTSRKDNFNNDWIENNKSQNVVPRSPQISTRPQSVRSNSNSSYYDQVNEDLNNLMKLNSQGLGHSNGREPTALSTRRYNHQNPTLSNNNNFQTNNNFQKSYTIKDPRYVSDNFNHSDAEIADDELLTERSERSSRLLANNSFAELNAAASNIRKAFERPRTSINQHAILSKTSNNSGNPVYIDAKPFSSNKPVDYQDNELLSVRSESRNSDISTAPLPYSTNLRSSINIRNELPKNQNDNNLLENTGPLYKPESKLINSPDIFLELRKIFEQQELLFKSFSNFQAFVEKNHSQVDSRLARIEQIVTNFISKSDPPNQNIVNDNIEKPTDESKSVWDKIKEFLKRGDASSAFRVATKSNDFNDLQNILRRSDPSRVLPKLHSELFIELSTKIADKLLEFEDFKFPLLWLDSIIIFNESSKLDLLGFTFYETINYSLQSIAPIILSNSEDPNMIEVQKNLESLMDKVLRYLEASNNN